MLRIALAVEARHYNNASCFYEEEQSIRKLRHPCPSYVLIDQSKAQRHGCNLVYGFTYGISKPLT